MTTQTSSSIRPIEELIISFKPLKRALEIFNGKNDVVSAIEGATDILTNKFPPKNQNVYVPA